MQNWQFWVALLVPLVVAVIAIIIAIRDSRRIRSIEEEVTEDYDLDVRWQPPDENGKAFCMLRPTGDNLKDVKIILPTEKREIGLLELRKGGKREEFQGVAYGTRYTISFKDPATGRKHTRRRIVRF